jgi:biopolymer transport protein ExbD/biopolymer transport protein TolR
VIRPRKGFVGVRARTADVQPDMNVTPLVDVVLVLLIIFMVVAPRLDQDVPIDLPGMFNPDAETKSLDPVKISIVAKGEYYYEAERFDLDGLTQRLQTLHAADPVRRLLLRGDAEVGYGAVREVLARCQEIGFPGISLLVGERQQRGTEAPAAAGAGS